MHPDFQGKGLYLKIRKFNEEYEQKNGLFFRTAISSNPVLIKRNLKRNNPPLPFTVSRLYRIKDIGLYVNNAQGNLLFKKVALHILKNFYRIRYLSNFKSDDNIDIEIKEIEKFDENIDSLWSDVREYYNYLVVRDMKYLNWRYCDPRGGKYIMREGRINGAVVVFCVLRIDKTDSSNLVGYIVDILTRPNEDGVLINLIRDALSYFDNADVN